MQLCGLVCGVNHWNQPLCLGTGTERVCGSVCVCGGGVHQVRDLSPSSR